MALTGTLLSLLFCIIPVLVHCITITTDNELLQTYDYIIVGTGIGGLVVANRLSQTPELNILIIESGELDDRNDQVEIPGLIGLDNPQQYFANLTTAPQEFLNDRVLPFSQGRVVGGSTILNGLAWTRSSQANIDAWEALGNPGWGWNGLLPYFIKSENFTTKNVGTHARNGLHIRPEPLSHGTDGAVHVGYPEYFYNQSQNLLNGLHQLGIPVNNDPNSGVSTGASVIPSSISPDNQSRSDARTAYLDSVISRPNLHLLTGHTAARIVHKPPMFPKALKATELTPITITSIEFAVDTTSPRKVVKCKKGVIIAAGAVFSPVLLQISGFGPRSVLENLGIDTVIDLPGVGRNFQDHPMVQVLYNYTAPSNIVTADKIWRPWTSPMVNTVALLPMSWILNRTEYHRYLIKASTEATAYLPDEYDSTLLAGYRAQQSKLISLLKDNSTAAYELMSTSSGQLSVSALQPLSRGVVQAISPSIFENNPPLIDPRYCAHPLDCETITYGLRFNARLIQTPAMRILRPLAQMGFGPSDVSNTTALDEAIRKRIGTEFHPSGTTAMLPRDKGGVVDPALLVHGTTNLRVVDAGIMPVVPGGHLQAVLYAMAEKAADIIQAQDLLVPAGTLPPPIPISHPPVAG
ncbi:GMC oxidoreductase [Xylariales sp. PMI_506]|nr:GMC oxidoreductase [Xylariales sp. PMI_506]